MKDRHYVIVASDGEEGTRLCKEHLPDLVITDLLMPKKSGLKTIVDLKKEFPAIKIIAMSGGGDFPADRYLTASEIAAADRSFQKPFPHDDLLDAIDELLK